MNPFMSSTNIYGASTKCWAQVIGSFREPSNEHGGVLVVEFMR